MAAFKLAIIGECMAELSGSLFSSMQQGFGGDTMNTAIYLKQLLNGQVQTSYVSVMGEDNLSNAMIEKWQGYGVDTQFVLRDPKRHCGLYMIQNEANGERHFQYWRSDAAAKFLLQHQDSENVFKQLACFEAIFLSGISLAILPLNDRANLMIKLKNLNQQGCKIIFDGNYRPALWQSIEHAQVAYQQMYEVCDLALVTFDDEAALWGDNSVDETISRLQPFNISELITKDGANGCFYTVNSKTNQIATSLVEQVVDTTAAGDSFNAGFLSKWLQNKSLAQACEMGNLVAGQVIQQKGAIVKLDSGILSV